jgi:hypothetical protein
MHRELFDRRIFDCADETVELVGNVLESSTACSIVATDPGGLILLWKRCRSPLGLRRHRSSP